MRTMGTIEKLLCYGEDHAIKSDRLMQITGMDKRYLQAMIAQERDQGAMICASDRGYFLPKDRSEAAAYYEHATKSARKLFYTLRHIKAFADLPEGQGGFDYEQY